MAKTKNKKAKKALLTPKTKTFLEKLNDLLSLLRNLDFLFDKLTLIINVLRKMSE